VQIKQLEEEIGVALFIRSKRHVEITRPGKVFLKTAREALVASPADNPRPASDY
jgi:DNA-binding transcriptional LysR family regulator